MMLVVNAAVSQEIKKRWRTLLRRVKSHKHFLLSVICAGLLFCFVWKLPEILTWLRVIEYGKMVRDEESWKPLTTRAAGWETPRAIIEEEGRNWAGLRKMREKRAVGSLWWDESAEEHFIFKLEDSQFPADCSKAHWISHHEWIAGLLSNVHIFSLPLFISMVRGHTLVPISDRAEHHAFDGCGQNLSELNMQCFFNVTSCNPGEDRFRLTRILAMHKEEERTTWDEVLMQEDDCFTEGGVTVMRSLKMPAWDTEVCVASSSFSSYIEAFSYHKLALWNAMGRHGKVGVVSDSTKTCRGSEDTRMRRAELVIASLMSSWMLNRAANSVKLVADEIMAKYATTSGQQLWQSPVLAIHIRQTDKFLEDPYYSEHGVYRPVEDYMKHMKQMEDEFGFKWPSIFLISDSGTAMESMMTLLNGNDSAAPQLDNRFIMYDWISDDHLVEKFNDHSSVPKALKRDMQTHFLATLYIVHKIADHAIVTHSSNVGRFIAEIISAKHRLAFVDREGPLVTSLDNEWVWHYTVPGYNTSYY